MSGARYLIDTNICVYIVDRVGPSPRRAEQLVPGEACISAITVAELARGNRLAGPMTGPAIEEFCRLFEPLAFDRAAALRFAGLPLQRNRFDRLIAAQASALGLTLVTNNEADFADIPDLRIENWTRP